MGEEGWRASQSACLPKMPGQYRTWATVPATWLPREMGAIFGSIGIRKWLQLHTGYHFLGESRGTLWSPKPQGTGEIAQQGKTLATNPDT